MIKNKYPKKAGTALAVPVFIKMATYKMAKNCNTYSILVNLI